MVLACLSGGEQHKNTVHRGINAEEQIMELHIYTYDVPLEVHSRSYCEARSRCRGVLNTYDISMFTSEKAEDFDDLYIHWLDGGKPCQTSVREMLAQESPYFGGREVRKTHNFQRLFFGYVWSTLGKDSLSLDADMVVGSERTDLTG